MVDQMLKFIRNDTRI